MEDIVARYLVQFAAITAGAMGLAEWGTVPVGKVGTSRKRYNALLYAWSLGALGLVAGLVEMPGETWWAELAGVTVMACVSVGAAHAAIAAKRALQTPAPKP